MEKATILVWTFIYTKSDGKSNNLGLYIFISPSLMEKKKQFWFVNLLTLMKKASFGLQIYLLYLMEEAMFFVCKFTCFQSDGKGNNSEYLTTDLATDK